MFQEQSIFFFYLVVSLFISFVISSANNDASSSNTHCPTSTCNGVKISYPFWRADNYNSSVPQYCGYPGFGINCPTDQPHPVIHLPGNTFYVTGIDCRKYSLTLVDTDVLNNVQCPRARHNLTIEKLPLEVSNSDSKLTFYFNCTKPPTGALPAECLKSNGKMTYFYVGESQPDDLNWFGICDEKVVATVMERRSFQNNDWIDKFGEAMGEGFQLDWRRTAECGQCEGSDGKCGYNNSTQRFLCYCKDGTSQTKTCKGTPKTSLYLSLVILI